MQCIVTLKIKVPKRRANARPGETYPYVSRVAVFKILRFSTTRLALPCYELIRPTTPKVWRLCFEVNLHMSLVRKEWLYTSAVLVRRKKKPSHSTKKRKDARRKILIARKANVENLELAHNNRVKRRKTSR